MNAYDFDDTIYAGESAFDFFKFCLKKDKKLYLYFPIVLFRLIEYKLNLSSIEKISKTVEKIVSKFINKYINEIDEITKQFWNKNYKKIKPTFIKKLKKEDLIITGCPDFLINYIKEDLKVENIICTKFNFETKKLDFLCLGENKVKAFNKEFKNKKIEKFYTDSLMDVPFMKYAKEVYLVKGNKCIKIDKKKYIK